MKHPEPLALLYPLRVLVSARGAVLSWATAIMISTVAAVCGGDTIEGLESRTRLRIRAPNTPNPYAHA